MREVRDGDTENVKLGSGEDEEEEQEEQEEAGKRGITYQVSHLNTTSASPSMWSVGPPITIQT